MIALNSAMQSGGAPPGLVAHTTAFRSAKVPPLPLVHANHKLGNGVWHFSLPAIDTCPGRTAACESACYACKGFYCMQNVKTRLQWNDEMRHDPKFVARVTTQIHQQLIDLVRIHPSGDFDTVAYIRKWQEIVTRRQTVKFWAYTRSWRDIAAERSGEDLLPELVTLSRLPNMQLFFSCDSDTGAPPKRAGMRRAYMMQNDEDTPKFKADLMFRVTRENKMVQAGGTIVCPAERQKAREGQKQVTCSQCQLCFNRVDFIDKYNAKLRLPVLT